jgi:hypothetical protein
MDNQVVLSADNQPSEKSVIIYRSEDGTIQIEVQLYNDTVWMNRQQMATLFDRDVKTIGKHIKNALSEELKGYSVVAKFATTATDGKNYQVEYYNIDMVLSIGYRVKSQRGIDYRHWANETLKQHLFRNYTTNQRIFYLEQKVAEHDKKIDFFVKTSLPPVEGVFYNGQIFDAYNFISDLVRKAKNEIILIDNYVDDSVLKILNKREDNVSATIYTAHISETLKLDLEKHNSQYQPINIEQFNKSHDRFMIIDNEVYHIGASLKDLGKRMFAFSKMEIGKEIILSIL